MTKKEMIERIEHVLKLAKMMPSKERADVGTLVAAIERELPPLLAALRSRPAPPDDLALRHAWEAGFRLCRSYGDNHHHFDGEQKERRWLDYIKGLAAPAPVAAPAPEERSPYDSGLCCMARHASAKPPWSCDCPCHTAPAPETRVSYSCPHCGREYDRPAPAPETEEPLDEIDTSGYDYSGGGR